MPKRLLHEAFESFLGTHVDPEKDEELKGAKAELEGKVHSILKILKEEDNDGKEQLQNLFADFYKHYQSLYERYEHLTEELRKKAYCEHEDSSSSRTDSSYLDDSPRKKGTKDGKVGSNVKIDAAGMKHELENALSEVAEFRRHLAVVTDEKESLNQEYQSALSKLQASQKIIAQLNAEDEAWNIVKSSHLAEAVEWLNTEVENTRKLQAELNKKRGDLNRERESLSIAKEAAESKFEEEKRNAEELRTINGQLQHEKHAMQVELEVVKGELSALREKLESTEIESNQIEKVAEEEKIGLSFKISQLEGAIKRAENKCQDLITEESQLNEKLDGKKVEFSSHFEIYEAAKKKLESAEKEIARLDQTRQDAVNYSTAFVSMLSKIQIDLKESMDQVQLLLDGMSRFNEFITEETRRISGGP